MTRATMSRMTRMVHNISGSVLSDRVSGNNPSWLRSVPRTTSPDLISFRRTSVLGGGALV